MCLVLRSSISPPIFELSRIYTARMKRESERNEDNLSVELVVPSSSRPISWESVSVSGAASMYGDLVAGQHEGGLEKGHQRISNASGVFSLRGKDGSFKDTAVSQMLPLLIDKQRNNIRSRPLLALVYGDLEIWHAHQSCMRHDMLAERRQLPVNEADG